MPSGVGSPNEVRRLLVLADGADPVEDSRAGVEATLTYSATAVVVGDEVADTVSMHSVGVMVKSGEEVLSGQA